MGVHSKISELCEDRVFHYFYEISQIPRGSGNEQAISDYVFHWAQNHGFFVIQDCYFNVFIRKEKAKNISSEESILLQAHMDMVCEKKTDSKHDFKKDGIPWCLEGDLLSSGGETTLGADDGIGMAIAMAILEEDSFEFPPLEVLFTTSEEEDLSGAEGFDMSYVKSSFLINLDHVNENEILCGSCGGEAAEVTIPVKWEKSLEGWKNFEIRVEGLKGGHSGEDIGAGHGNANKILARLLYELSEKEVYGLCDFKGGNFRLAIPREAQCTVAMSEEKFHRVSKWMDAFKEMIKEEYESAAENIQIYMRKSNQKYDNYCKPYQVIIAILLSPDGIFEMSSNRKGDINTSDNLGEVYLEEQGCRMIYEIRSLYDSSKQHLKKLIKMHAENLGGTCQFYFSYPSWKYKEHSKLRNVAETVYQKNNHEKPRIYCVHAGLECGSFFEKKPDLDAISIGPNCWGLHSPEETLSISSVKKFYINLKEILKNANKT